VDLGSAGRRIGGSGKVPPTAGAPWLAWCDEPGLAHPGPPRTLRPMTDLLVVGGGKMGEALIGGLIAPGWAGPAALAVVEPAAPRRDALADLFPGLVLVADMADAPAATAAVVAVKPDQVAEVCRVLGASGVTRILSIAAGVQIASMEAAVPAGT